MSRHVGLAPSGIMAPTHWQTHFRLSGSSGRALSVFSPIICVIAKPAMSLESSERKVAARSFMKLRSQSTTFNIEVTSTKSTVRAIHARSGQVDALLFKLRHTQRMPGPFTTFRPNIDQVTTTIWSNKATAQEAERDDNCFTVEQTTSARAIVDNLSAPVSALTIFPGFLQQYLVVRIVESGWVSKPFPPQRVRPRERNHLLRAIVPAVEERLERGRVQRFGGHLILGVRRSVAIRRLLHESGQQREGGVDNWTIQKNLYKVEQKD